MKKYNEFEEENIDEEEMKILNARKSYKDRYKENYQYFEMNDNTYFMKFRTMMLHKNNKFFNLLKYFRM